MQEEIEKLIRLVQMNNQLELIEHIGKLIEMDLERESNAIMEIGLVKKGGGK